MKRKLYMFYLSIDYSGGLLIVAATDQTEACQIAKRDDYGEHWQYSGTIVDAYYEGDKSCIVASQAYVE